ncbi:MAG: ABC transporter ATP-binding protein [Gemmatimonadetes bacterium]|nr:ABC transporter ATP-binding protein [Gemmatimonadota bacterium]
MKDAPAVSFERVERVYASGPSVTRALGPIDLELEIGEFVAIMGPSGSGKSTLLSLAGALDRPTAGRVRLRGVDLATRTASQLATLRRRSLGYVFQDLNLLPGLTACENVALPRELDGASIAVARREALEALDTVGLGHLAERFPEDLSGGERQRVAVARAFVGARELVLADEPTGALDSMAGERVLRLLRERCDESGCTVVLVTHDATHAGWADRVLFLRDGLLASEARGSARLVPGV